MKNLAQRVVALCVVLGLTACGEPHAEQNPAPKPLSIDVVKAQEVPVQAWHTYTTRLEAPEQVILKARVSGQIDKVMFEEGQKVSQGQVLFSIDSRPFKAEVKRLEAELISAQAGLDQARREALRAKRLLSNQAMSHEQADQRASTLRQAEAGVNAILAQLESAKLNLEFSQVSAPISGVISRALVTAGNYVFAGQTTLTTIVSDQKAYAYFDIDERTWNRDFSTVSAQDHLPVSLEPLEREQPVPGVIDFIDNQIDTTTGTLRVRGVFDAKAYHLLPGAFARVSIAAQEVKPLPVIPERAIGTDLKNRFVLIVDEQNTLQYRLVKLGEQYDQYRAITSGLKAGERIAANGPARVGPGMPITPNEVSLDLEQVAFSLGAKAEKSTLANRLAK